jgi:transglutaminase-like putative cysteine protease
VYSEAHEAFLFHTWTESWIDGSWQAIDPTFGQLRADATHFLLAEGEEPVDLVELTDWVGRLSIEIVSYAHGQ